MVLIVSLLFIVFGGVILHHVLQKADFTPLRAFVARFSSPYNGLVTFSLCFLLLLGGHNRPVSCFGGSLVILGFCTLAGHVLRLARAAYSLIRAQSAGSVAADRPGRRPRLVWEESDNNG